MSQRSPTSPRIAVHSASRDGPALALASMTSNNPARSRNASAATTDSSAMTLAEEEERDLLAVTSNLRNQHGDSPTSKAKDKQKEKEKEEPIVHAGTLPAHLYDAYLPGWVGQTRRLLMKYYLAESRWIAKMQTAYRSPRRDQYFVTTALLGTHSFFLIFLPLSFWLGSAYFGRGLINVLAFGVYLTSAIKDLVCVPRPLSPPVVRLSVGTHHLEYGFPSTHSANAVSIALYCYLWVTEARSAAAMTGQGGAGWYESRIWEVMLSYYTLSVVGGRIYAGMHSFTDCIAGSIMGALITMVQWWLFPLMERCLIVPDWTVPAVIIPVGLAMVNFHPQPMDDCPCFEDAIAFIAVAMGVTLGRWIGVRNGLAPAYDHPLRPQPFHPYNPSTIFAHLKFLPDASAKIFGEKSGVTSVARHIAFGNKYVASGISAARAAEDRWASWAGRALAMFVVGSVVILVVRIVVKATAQLLLPPTFRFVFRFVGFALPRRFYISSQDYKRIPQHLQPIPSVLDLSSMGQSIGPFEPNRALSPSPQPPSRGGSPASSSFTHSYQTHSLLRAASPQPYLPRASSPLARQRQQPGNLASTSALAEQVGATAGVPHRRAQFSLGNGSASGEISMNASLSSLPSRSGTATPPLSRNNHPSRQPSNVEYPLGSHIPVPLTQTHGRQANGLDIPGEDAPERVAAALRNTNADIGGLEDPNVKRYDADVLTKVLTYGAIGLFGSALLPIFFEHVGWIRP
ncbi:unnamed protein product [Tilletia controversa]|uniref:Phosphatidic acid phosphatase type 2/haloperoxidase domain-containing protein n=3 Tax=Tilletia TaxID=13289 RepID=A0A8X7MUJ8_9BASI|nr:hypothetical protein CF336_g3005 [Tilletia laevis]KAE8201160.1 hypothetical protein CF328_g2759 [Tilletia controversa]KAE8262550.1 hypothetical protein A4X03_0g2370 [Tilletia caries]KAE8202914.1 hypothetical protein CF335_g3231 [Tilletia laevis]KAE8249000.1 hypothetical protein A4X06_0g3431 [Tilletia controversa]